MRVVIAEDQVLLREGLARLFADGGHEVVAALGDASDLLGHRRGHRPDLVVLDIRMPPTFTDEGARAARRSSRRTPTSACSCSPSTSRPPTSSTSSARRLRLPAQGPRARGAASSSRPPSASRAAARRSTREVVGRLLAPHGADGPLAELSEREREMLELMAEGLTNTGDRQAAVRQRAHRRGARAPRADASSTSRRARTATAASSPCWPTSAPRAISASA